MLDHLAHNSRDVFFLELADRASLLKNDNTDIARLAQALFVQAKATRIQVIEEYLPAPAAKGNTARGANVFERE